MIDGIKIYSKNNSLVFIIVEISDELKNIIRENLTAICHGADKAHRNSRLYSFKNTLKEFLVRYESKTPNTQKGMIGELLAHIVFLSYNDGFISVNPFFNMEERSIKKGFDILFIEPACNNRLWITEVKSGNLGKSNCSGDKNDVLLKRAKNDLNKRLNENNSQIWLNAIHGAAIAVKDSNTKKEVYKILEDILAADYFTSKDKNVILTSVLFNDINDCIKIDDVVKRQKKFLHENLFSDVIVVSIQKNAYQAVIKYLKEEIT